jgi:hypothetical protein
MVPACSAKVSHTNIPSCTMWFRQFIKYVTKTNHKVWCHPHSTEHDTQPIAYLICNQAIPYRTHGGTCCPRVSTPKIRPLVDSSMTNHFTWRNPAISTIPYVLKPQHQSLPRSNHISMDRRPSLTKTQANLNIINDGKTCTTLMTTWMSITNTVLNPNHVKVFKACRPMCTLEREREHIESIWSRVTCLALLLATAQCLECWDPGDSQSLRLLRVAIENKQYKQVNKQYTK